MMTGKKQQRTVGRGSTVGGACALAVLLTAFPLAGAAAVEAEGSPRGPAEILSPESVQATAVPGGIVRIPLPEGAGRARFQDKPVLVYRGQAIIGVAIDSPPGDYAVEFSGPGGTAQHRFRVVAKAYPEQHLTIENRRMVDPLPADLERIRDERRRQLEKYDLFTYRELDIAPFVQPVEGITSSPYGHRRILNGQPRSPHSGLDIAAATGTPIRAPAAGRVVLTGDLFFNGKTVFLDHGQGLVTMYCHMNGIDVREGDEVMRGESIGQVGATGRVTGAHLHWSVSLNGNRVDPVPVMEILNDSGSGRSG